MSNKILKKLLAILFIISLLGNYMLPLNNVVIASEDDSADAFRAAIRGNEEQVQEPETNGEEQVTENAETEPAEEVTENGGFDDVLQDVTVEEQAVPQEQEVTEPEAEPVDIAETELAETSSANITVNTEMSLMDVIKYDNSDSKGMYVDAELCFQFSSDDQNVETNAYVVLDMPQMAGVLPDAYEIISMEDNMIISSVDELEEFERAEAENNSEVVPETETIIEEIDGEQVERVVEKEVEATKVEYVSRYRDGEKIVFYISNVYSLLDERVRIVFIYSDKAFDEEEFKVDGKLVVISTIGVNNEVVDGEFTMVKAATENTVSMAGYSIFSKTPSKYKGYFYANALSNTKKEITFSTVNVAEIVDAEIADDLVITEKANTIETTNNEISLTNLTYYKKTEISKESFDKVLGEKGKIEIYNRVDEKIKEINSDTELVDGYYTVTYENEYDSLKFVLKDVKNPGRIEIQNEKAIKANDSFSKVLVDSFNNIKIETESKVIKRLNLGEITVQSVTSIGAIKLEATETRVELDLNDTDLSTEVENEVTMNIKLRTDSEKYELFKNPTLQIAFPPSVENVEIKNINLLYKNDLSIANWEVGENAAGDKVIYIALEGIQEEYAPGEILDGTNINVVAKVTLNRLTPNDQGSIKLTYSNEGGTNTTYQLEGKDCQEYVINYVSRSGLLKETTLTNFNSNLDVIDEFNTEHIVGKIDAHSDSKVSTLGAKVLNNFGKDIEDVVIVGKIPYTGNTDENGNDLSSEFDTVLQGRIRTTGSTANIFYSSNEEETITGDGWQENVTDFSEMKAYKIVLDSEVMHKGERLDFEYDVLIPENVSYNSESYGIYSIYYTVDGQNMIEKSTIGMVTEEMVGAVDEYQKIEEAGKLRIGTTAYIGENILGEDEDVNERQIVRYEVAIENTTNETLRNIEIKAKGHNANLYTTYIITDENYQGTGKRSFLEFVEDDGTITDKKEYETAKIDTIAAYETKYFTFEIFTKTLEECEDKVTYGEISVKGENIPEQTVETTRHNLRDAKLELVTKLARTENPDRTDTFYEDEFEFFTIVKNISDEELNNVVLNFVIPKELEYDISSKSYRGNDLSKSIREEGTNLILSVLIPEIDVNEERGVYVISKIKNSNAESETIKVKSYANVGDDVYYSNLYSVKAYGRNTIFDYTFDTANSNDTVKDGDEIRYVLTLKNVGARDSYAIGIKDIFPNGLVLKEARIKKDEKVEEVSIEESNNLYLESTLKKDETLILEIDTIVTKAFYAARQNIIENALTIQCDNIDEDIRTNVITFKILDNEYQEEEITETVGDKDLSEGNETQDIAYQGDEEEVNTEIPASNPEQPIENTTPTEEITEPVINESTVEEPAINNNTEPENEEPVVNNEEKANTGEVTNNKTEETVSNNETIKQEETTTVQPQTNNSQTTSQNNNNSSTSSNRTTRTNTTQTTNNSSINATKTSSLTTTTSAVSSVAKKYKISGKAWNDKDRNGIFEERDEVVPNMTVVLYRTVSSDNNNRELTERLTQTKTDSKGTYTFDKLEEGKYIVLFEYDNENYLITTYKSKQAKEAESSSVVTQTVEINGKKQVVALSDIIYLSSNYSNINAGIYEREIFDFSLNKYIVSTIVENANGTDKQTYSPDNDIVKLEIPSKYIDGSKVRITYVIEVANEGDISGYVGSVTDYLPEGLDFDENLNKEWHLDKDGNLYNYSLMNTVLNPGKTTKLYLTLTKEMTNDNTGIFENSAEITKTSNEKGKQDFDSVENNKVKEEDDFDSVSIMIGVKTGAIVYIGISILIVLIVSAIMYLIIKRKTIR